MNRKMSKRGTNSAETSLSGFFICFPSGQTHVLATCGVLEDVQIKVGVQLVIAAQQMGVGLRLDDFELHPEGRPFLNLACTDQGCLCAGRQRHSDPAFQ